MNGKMTAPTRRELVEALRQRYAAATREEKARMISEFAAVSGLHRKSAIRVLNAEAEPTASTGAPWTAASLRAGSATSPGHIVGGVGSDLWEAAQSAFAGPICGVRKTRSHVGGYRGENAPAKAERGNHRSIAGANASGGVWAAQTTDAITSST